MLLMDFLGVFTDSMEDDCLVLGVAKDKSLVRIFQLFNIEINNTFINTI